MITTLASFPSLNQLSLFNLLQFYHNCKNSKNCKITKKIENIIKWVLEKRNENFEVDLYLKLDIRHYKELKFENFFSGLKMYKPMFVNRNSFFSSQFGFSLSGLNFWTDISEILKNCYSSGKDASRLEWVIKELNVINNQLPTLAFIPKSNFFLFFQILIFENF